MLPQNGFHCNVHLFYKRKLRKNENFRCNIAYCISFQKIYTGSKSGPSVILNGFVFAMNSNCFRSYFRFILNT